MNKKNMMIIVGESIANESIVDTLEKSFNNAKGCAIDGVYSIVFRKME